MKIALLGYGKMGKAIEQIAIKRGHEIALIVNKETKDFSLEAIDVAIDFSLPDAAFENITQCFKQNTPVISGTTGWLDKYEQAVALCKKMGGAFIYASNFSLGVNVFFELNNYLARIMAQLEQYRVHLEEIHHTQKLDAPSGTAITLAESIIKHSPNYTNWKLQDPAQNEIPISAQRIPEVPGTHTVTYESTVDTIEIKHMAHNREGFALGAVVAAEWLFGKKGVYTMKDVLNLG
ncbi:4-hydroxy-tetrahydrodipicolinate reductase [Ascidiimonas aurantiaca]|uniref:4-hydroxy-tetrahydrodipicolinate reductase n=1 Tax=Ascidiimonas aurantiaca TaxID=1685432 RepID=UPI0030EE37B5